MGGEFYYPSLESVIHTFCAIDFRENNRLSACLCKLQVLCKICQTLRHNLDTEPFLLSHLRELLSRQLTILGRFPTTSKFQRILDYMKLSLEANDSNLLQDLAIGTVNLLGCQNPEILSIPYDKDQPVHEWCTCFLTSVDEEVRKKISSLFDNKQFSYMYNFKTFLKYSLELETATDFDLSSGLNILVFWVSTIKLFSVCVQSQFLLDSLVAFNALFQNHVKELEATLEADTTKICYSTSVVWTKLSALKQLLHKLQTSTNTLIFEEIMHCLRGLQIYIKCWPTFSAEELSESEAIAAEIPS
ncbi:protein G49 [Wood mouse herpesvirus]|uniref:Protein G49 n=1 Tax=Wood mouse herpesvirus TaxID=432370 RepID=D0U1N8_9GAMA|nr:protein G49 [Wood mouse herpesvirus]ACY41120.1 protein G49 [Wood mouse herpesvirus]